jgi:hypothetical protein
VESLFTIGGIRTRLGGEEVSQPIEINQSIELVQFSQFSICSAG